MNQYQTHYNTASLQISAECLCASVLLCVGVVTMVGRFKDIKLTTELNKRYNYTANIWRDILTSFTEHMK